MFNEKVYDPFSPLFHFRSFTETCPRQEQADQRSKTKKNNPQFYRYIKIFMLSRNKENP